jgi:hypothetical protein
MGAQLPDGNHIEGPKVLFQTHITNRGTWLLPNMLFPSPFPVLLGIKSLGISKLLPPRCLTQQQQPTKHSLDPDKNIPQTRTYPSQTTNEHTKIQGAHQQKTIPSTTA